MKMSVSLPGEDVRFLDEYAAAHALPSRSAPVQQAIRVFRLSQLNDAYGDAWEEWRQSDDADVWEATVNDGL